MNRLFSGCCAEAISLGCLVFFGAVSVHILESRNCAAEELGLKKEASWSWPSQREYSELLSSYLEQVDADPVAQGRVLKLVSDGGEVRGPELLDRLLAAAGVIDPRISDLTRQLHELNGKIAPLRELSWLTSDVPGWLQDAVRLAFGRAYAQQRLYDEALETLAGLELSQVCDPASLLFYRATAEHHLLKKTECLENIQVLLQREDELPHRYAQIARLMKADLTPVKEDSLDEISRMMGGVQRRLELGRAGQVVREEEENIIKKLDKLIDQIEQQAQQMMQQSSSQDEAQQQQQQAQQQQAMDDSQIAGGSGPGDVDPKQFQNQSAWGNLPPAQRQEALQRMTEELPSHYRDVIEGYFRRLAKDR